MTIKNTLKHIENQAKTAHTKLLLTALGAVTCFAIGGTTLQSTKASTHSTAPSTALAKKTDLGTDLVGHQFHSKQFTALLVHQFQEQNDSDIDHGVQSDVPSPTARFRLRLGYIKAYNRDNNAQPNSTSSYSVVSDAQNANNNQMVYFVTKHDLFIRQINMMGQSNSTIRTVKYRLHTVANNNDGTDTFTFYPTEFSKKWGNIKLIPKHEQKNYPMHLYVNNGGTHRYASSTSSHHSLLP